MATKLQNAVSEYDERLEPATTIETERVLQAYIRALELRQDTQQKLRECEEKEGEAIIDIIRTIGPRAFAIKGVTHHACCSKDGRVYFRASQQPTLWQKDPVIPLAKNQPSVVKPAKPKKKASRK